jgi:imidazolonepropionase-like amidohydrolase
MNINFKNKVSILKAIFTQIVLFIALKNNVLSQNPVPALSQPKPIVLQNATIHIGNGNIIQNGEIQFESGIIKYVGVVTKNFPNNANVIDLKGKHIYPGLISMANILGLSDVESIAAVNDYREMGSLNPNIRTLVAYNTDSDVIPTVRGNGILISQATPQNGLISGQSSIFYLDGWNWQDAVLKADDGVWINWPPIMSRNFSFETFTFTVSKNEKRNAAIQELEKLLTDTKAYSISKTTDNLKLAAMAGLFDASKRAYVRADQPKEIIEAVQFLKKNGVKNITIFGGSHAMECASFLKDNDIAVVISSTHETPSRGDDPVYQNYKLAYDLQVAGVEVVISYGDLGWRTRNLPFLAGTAVSFGLDKEQALKMITLNPAKLIGLEKQVGSLEIGKHASLIVSKGDILDMRTNTVEMAFIQGKEITLDDKQKALARKFEKNIK